MDEKLIAMVFRLTAYQKSCQTPTIVTPPLNQRSGRLRDGERCVFSEMMDPSPFGLIAEGTAV